MDQPAPRPELTMRERYLIIEEHLEAAVAMLDAVNFHPPAIHTQHALDLLRNELCGR